MVNKTLKLFQHH